MDAVTTLTRKEVAVIRTTGELQATTERRTTVSNERKNARKAKTSKAQWKKPKVNRLGRVDQVVKVKTYAPGEAPGQRKFGIG